MENGEKRPPSGPADATAFWSAGADLDGVELPNAGESGPTLERLVPSPFPRSGFPLIGLLATVYDHVSSIARKLQATGGMGKRGTSGV